MLERHPPRRDPRVLVLLASRERIAYAALDAWEARGLGELPRGSARSLALRLARIVIQTRPSTIVIAGPRGSPPLAAIARRIAEPRGVDVLMPRGARLRALGNAQPTLAELRAQFPETRLLPDGPPAEALALAAAALTTLVIHRRYAPSTTAPARLARLASPGARRLRPPRVPHGRAARARLRPAA